LATETPEDTRDGAFLWSRRVLPVNLFHILEYTRFKSYVPEPEVPLRNDLDVLAAVIAHSLSEVLKKGIVRDYTDHSEITSHPHGHIDVPASVKTRAIARRKLYCDYQMYDELTFCNSFIASVVSALLTGRLGEAVYAKLAEVARPLSGLPRMPLTSQNAEKAIYKGRDRDYADLLEFCKMFVYDMLPSSVSSGTKVSEFISDQRFFALYEEFLRCYYAKEHPELFVAKRKIDWKTIDWCSSERIESALPDMETDVRLAHGGKVLIMDAKCYAEPMKSKVAGSAPKYDSANMYQMIAYAENLKRSGKKKDGRVATMLVYAVLDGSFADLSGCYEIDGTLHHIEFLNLGADWPEVQEELEGIAAGVEDGSLFSRPE
jgi:5-methylcytosine-specific restriction enzyme subunit McrC